MARQLNLEYFTTTLTISPLKNADVLNVLGEEFGRKYGVKFCLLISRRKEAICVPSNCRKNMDFIDKIIADVFSRPQEK